MWSCVRQIYFMGIIDILQQWNLGKKTERLAKVYLLNSRAADISAAPPAEYAERFKAFIAAACGYAELARTR
jgi:hypothetical protein